MKMNIIMPCFNGLQYLPRSLGSIECQGCKDWTLYFINDGSTDGSLEFAQKFAEVDPRIKIFSGSNQGVASALNYGRSKILENTDGNDLVVYCGADDWYYPEYLDTFMNEFKKDPDLDFMYCDRDSFFPNGEPAVSYGIAYHDILDVERLPIENPIVAPSVCHKVKCFSVGEFDTKLSSIEDWDYNCRIAHAGYKMVHLKKVLLNVTVRDERWAGEGVSGKRTDEQMKIFQQKRAEEAKIRLDAFNAQIKG